MIRTLGFDQTAGALDALNAVGRNPGPVLRLAGAKMQEQIGRTFRAAKDPITGAPWKPLSSLRREGRGSSPSILRDTQQLLRSLISSAPIVSGNSVAIATPLVYARLHQEGGNVSGNPNLAIPLTRDASRAGGARDWMNRNANRKPFFFTSKTKKVFIVTKERTGLEFHFILLPSVTIPQRRFLGWGPDYIREIEALMVAYVRRQMGGTANA